MSSYPPSETVLASDMEKAEKSGDSNVNNGVSLHRVDSETIVDAVWGKMGEGATNYRNLGW
jgi:hypothetical protein